MAVDFLRKKNFQIIAQNYFVPGGEIDIIAQLGEIIVFIEVKSLKSEAYITLEETITQRKRRYLVKACRIWLHRKRIENQDWRIDFIGIILDNEKRIQRILHLENAIF